jgi:class 3 adenylate cyclase
MVKPCPEIDAVVRRWMAAHSDKKSRLLTNLLSTSEHIRYLGSAPDEYWAGSMLRRGLAHHIAEIPNWSAHGAIVESFEHSDVGWAVWRGQINFANREAAQDVRFSFVLTLDDGDWRFVQVHCSIAQPNLEGTGIEHNAFDELIEAAKTGHDGFDGEGTAVIMFTDVANSTEIANAVGDREWAIAIGRQLDLQTSEIIKVGGNLIKTLGDGSMSSFTSSSNAMRAAVAIQSIAAASIDEPELKLRIGIHAGDIIRADGDFFGTVVNKASRITGLAQPGEILVSDIARAMIGDREEFQFGDPISVALRGIEGQHSISELQCFA